jgi:hypothetical protein
MAIRCGRSGHSHDTVAEVRACQIPTPTKTLQMAGAPNGLRSFETTKSEVGYTSARTGPVIQAAKPKSFNPQDLEDGIYLHDMIVYKVIVAVHGSGRKYSKRLSDDGEWSYAAGAVRFLRPEHKMTLEQALTIGKIQSTNVDGRLYGRCFVCGRTLTDEASIKKGIGPVCEEGF